MMSLGIGKRGRQYRRVEGLKTMAFAHPKYDAGEAERRLKSPATSGPALRRDQPRWGALFALVASAALWLVVITVGVALAGRL
jgi:hypothetical protein